MAYFDLGSRGCRFESCHGSGHVAQLVERCDAVSLDSLLLNKGEKELAVLNPKGRFRHTQSCGELGLGGIDQAYARQYREPPQPALQIVFCFSFSHRCEELVAGPIETQPEENKRRRRRQVLLRPQNDDTADKAAIVHLALDSLLLNKAMKRVRRRDEILRQMNHFLVCSSVVERLGDNPGGRGFDSHQEISFRLTPLSLNKLKEETDG